MKARKILKNEQTKFNSLNLIDYTHTIFDVIVTVLKAKDWEKPKPRICADQLCSELIQHMINSMERVSVGSESQ